MTEDGQRDALRAALAGLWQVHRSEIDALVEDLRAAVVAAPSSDASARAQRAAHRLAGSLGTFGLADGTRVARQLETCFAASAGEVPPDVAVTGPLVEQLTAIVASFEGAAAPGDEPVPAATPPRRRATRTVAIVGFSEPLATAIAGAAAARGAATIAIHDLDAVDARTGDHPVDAVVIDLDRADLELENGAPWPALPPVVAVSTGRRLADRVAATRRGARRYVQLPASAAEIVASVESLWSARRRTATVVAVDDDQMILDTLRVLLADEDVFLVAVDDQEQFWRAVHDHHPDVIMLDVDMPEISGIELCRVLRSDDRWQQTGIIFLTAHRDPKTVHAVFEAGADDMVVKPIIGPELRARIASRIDRTDLHRRLAESDGLTGLTNRATSQRMTERMADAARATGRPLSVALVDLDHFKGVNDVHGHHAGDEVLRRFAALVRDARPSLAGRWGGEEFLLVYDGIDGREAAGLVDHILVALREEQFDAAGGGTFRCSFSAGVAELALSGTGIAALVQQADDALYRAKANGRNQVLVAGPSRPDGASDDTSVA